MPRRFARLEPVPDHARIEAETLARWDRDRVFERLREQNADGPTFSFIDGPVTANKVMGVHTAWGRTLKDVFQRYQALRGRHQRYQNGWDCQGLRIEVGVEKSIGLNSKREIEEYGLERFAARRREVVAWSSDELRRASQRLGMWMDWERDYYTFSDTNIEYIWRFLRVVHDRGWLFRGHRSTEWCPRCGTSLSQHELSQAGVHHQREDSSLYLRVIGEPAAQPPGDLLGREAPPQIVLHELAQREVGRELRRLGAARALVGERVPGRRAVAAVAAIGVALQFPRDRRRQPPQAPSDHADRLAAGPAERDLLALGRRQAAPLRSRPRRGRTPPHAATQRVPCLRYVPAARAASAMNSPACNATQNGCSASAPCALENLTIDTPGRG
jgi:tRNA synthetases class I (I, L, M and V)